MVCVNGASKVCPIFLKFYEFFGVVWSRVDGPLVDHGMCSRASQNILTWKGKGFFWYLALCTEVSGILKIGSTQACRYCEAQLEGLSLGATAYMTYAHCAHCANQLIAAQSSQQLSNVSVMHSLQLHGLTAVCFGRSADLECGIILPAFV